jgi:hypothetical protein
MRIHFASLYRLLAATIISQSVYLGYVLLFPLTKYGDAGRPYDMEILSRGRPWMGWLWAAGLVVLYAAFAWGLLNVDGSRRTRTVILGGGLVFAGTLIWLYPVTATDLFQYVLRARVQVLYGANPLLVAPSAFPQDPLLPFAGEWQGILSPYGPAWELLAGIIARLGAVDAVSGALAFKGVAFAAYLGITGLLLWHGRRSGDAVSVNRGLLLWAWNPLVLLQGLGNGHNDMVMLLGVTGALVLLGSAWQRERAVRWAAAALLLALAVMVKLAAALLVVLAVVAVVRAQPHWRQRFLALATMGAVGAAVALLTYIPYWPPWESAGGVLDEMANRYTYTVAATLRMTLREMLPRSAARWAPRLTGQLMFLFFFAWAVVGLWRRRLDLALAGFVAYLAFLLGGASYRIWYPLWLVPLAALHPLWGVRWRVLLLCFTSEMSLVFFYYVWRWYMPEATWLEMHLLVTPWQYGLPLIVPIVWELRGKDAAGIG